MFTFPHGALPPQTHSLKACPLQKTLFENNVSQLFQYFLQTVYKLFGNNVSQLLGNLENCLEIVGNHSCLSKLRNTVWNNVSQLFPNIFQAVWKQFLNRWETLGKHQLRWSLRRDLSEGLCFFVLWKILQQFVRRGDFTSRCLTDVTSGSHWHAMPTSATVDLLVPRPSAIQSVHATEPPVWLCILFFLSPALQLSFFFFFFLSRSVYVFLCWVYPRLAVLFGSNVQSKDGIGRCY